MPGRYSLSKADWEWIMEPLSMLAECRLCPRNCGVDRLNGELGFCRNNQGWNVSSVVRHMGEEPAIGGDTGICNIFFSHCNLQCRFCQNHQISSNQSGFQRTLELKEILGQILDILDEGVSSLGFVSPSHQIPQMIAIVRALHRLDRHPVIVYNSNGYDKVESLKELEGIVDVYLPDFKYAISMLGQDLSGCSDYPVLASEALKEMIRQKGAGLICDDQGRAVFGIIVRHLVLPGQVENSIEVLRLLNELAGPKIHVSLMSQYHPSHKLIGDAVFGRTITGAEYERVKEEFFMLGFSKGWVQETSSHAHYLPDFSTGQPFKN